MFRNKIKIQRNNSCIKFGLLVTTPKKNTTEKFINIGDDIQYLAIRNIYYEMGISDDKIIYINFNDIKTYDGDYVILPINFNIQTDYNCIPFPKRIIPVFIGLSLFATSNLTKEIIDYLRIYEPIGCRDEQTFLTLSKVGVDVYLAGCVSATLQKRKKGNLSKKIFIVDVEDNVKEIIPDYIRNCDNTIELSHILYNNTLLDYKNGLYEAKQRLETYRKEAKLIITSRLHCLSPCMAMGIPVIGLFSNISPRMGWIDKLIPLYTVDDRLSINWNGYLNNYETTKKLMKKIIKDKIYDTYVKYKNIIPLSFFFENRERARYGNFYYKKIKELPFCANDRFRFFIWGAGQIGKETIRCMKESFPNAVLSGVIDSYSYGKDFMGILIDSPEAIEKKYKNDFCIITTYSGEEFVISKLNKINKSDYISFASVNG